MPLLIGIGAPLGSVESLRRLISHIPVQDDTSWLIVYQMHSGYERLLRRTINSVAKMPVEIVRDGTRLLGGKIYLLPADCEVRVLQKRFSLKRVPNSECTGRKPIDIAFNSLATRYRSFAYGIVLAGNNNDGLEGVKSIKREGGMVIAEAPNSIIFSETTHNDIAHNYANWVLLPESIPTAILSGMISHDQWANTNTLFNLQEEVA